jgi:hypothetical protein
MAFVFQTTVQFLTGFFARGGGPRYSSGQAVPPLPRAEISNPFRILRILSFLIPDLLFLIRCLQPQFFNSRWKILEEFVPPALPGVIHIQPFQGFFYFQIHVIQYLFFPQIRLVFSITTQ